MRRAEATAIVIVGGGLAGHVAAVEVRRQLPDADITLLAAEPLLPYQRPPLSKGVLFGDTGLDTITLDEAPRYEALRINYRSNTPAISIDRRAATVQAADGEKIRYERLLLATGSRYRRLPASIDSPRFHYLRTYADALRLQAELQSNRSVVVIGGGFIGLEVAAAARTRGCEVTIVEASNRVLSRGTPPIAGSAVEHLHRRHGAALHFGQNLLNVEETAKGSLSLEFTSLELETDVVVVGIGAIPNTELASDAGLAVDDGIIVDEHGLTCDEAIFAAGDATRHPDHTGELRRLESWQSATEQAVVAARNMSGLRASHAPVPWLWSDQYDANLQVVGSFDFASQYLLKGELTSPSWTLIAMDRSDIAVGGIAMNSGRDISMLRSAIRKRSTPPPALSTSSRPVRNSVETFMISSSPPRRTPQ
jgi:NADPH-dependent 2,4-dienoyl-CoA reductase/sulfur reductase-like enzyme